MWLGPVLCLAVLTTIHGGESSSLDMSAVRAMINRELYQGDILVPKPAHSAKGRAPPLVGNAGVAQLYYLWPNGVIPYVINADFSGDDVATITRMMKQFEAYTCIRFKEKSDDDHEFVNIFKGVGCYASVGRDPDNPQGLVSLGEGCMHPGTVAHELMHVVGFYHEHSRSDRDDYLIIHGENIKPSFASEFIKLDPRNERIVTSFDYNSIMLYGPLAFSKDDVSITMEPKLPGFTMMEVYQKPGLTTTDVEGITTLYESICNSK